MVTADQVRRRITHSGLPERLTRLRFRSADTAEVLAMSATVAADPELLDTVAHYANRLIAVIGDIEDHPQVWEDVPAPAGLPSGSVPLLALLATVDEVSAWHRGRGIDEDASLAALADVGQQVFVHRLAYGEFGLHTHSWLTWAWSGALYWLGRLQFNLQRTQLADEGQPQWVLSTHIPRLGPLDAASVDESFAQARRFFARYFADVEVGYFYCESWLLDPVVTELLPHSNLAGFQRRWSRFGESKPGNEDVLFFVFERRPDSPDAGDELPGRTSLQRAAAPKLSSAAPWISAKGIFPVSEAADGGTR